MERFVALVFFAGLLTACAGSVNLPPKAGPEEVRLINPRVGQAVPDGYRTIGPVTAELPLGTPNQQVMTALLTRAAQLGADAVILQSVGSSTEGQITGGVDREERIIVRGLAIYFPAPDPDA